MLKTRQTCRVCGSKLHDVFTLGKMNIVGYHSSDSKGLTRKVPLSLTRCDPASDENACGLLQLRHTAPSNLMYRSYYYRSGINTTMKNHLFSLAQKSIDVSKVTKDDLIIDIGCNDGTSLSYFREQGYKNLFGFDPAKNMSQHSKKTGATIVEDYFNYGSFLKSCGKRASLISSIAMFYDLENPHDFVSAIRMALDNKGVWVLELAYMPATLYQNAFDTICHEHLEYYCLSSLEYLLNMHFLEVIDVYENDVNGGSFQVYVAHKGERSITPEAEKRIGDMRAAEFEMGFDTSYPYESFANRVKENCKLLVDFVRRQNDAGKTVYAYGASTKGSITLQYCGLTSSDIVACADRNPDKWGLSMDGSGVPIISEDEARRMKPDYFLVLPWHFLPEFLEREKDFLDQGGKFIVPMPEFKVIGA